MDSHKVSPVLEENGSEATVSALSDAQNRGTPNNELWERFKFRYTTKMGKREVHAAEDTLRQQAVLVLEIDNEQLMSCSETQDDNFVQCIEILKSSGRQYAIFAYYDITLREVFAFPGPLRDLRISEKVGKIFSQPPLIWIGFSN
ncbi:uncharacterized protein PV07_12678 [Cladophialophora immunda]|uniref:Uncharacterized protein n=1 Tax=Cladophialophora immunda TaxID=569365 RepID=A0A0D2BS86_9EURO|nr:uncharacterized protein PV07_12678 [Cladophialophora immunda]KIW21913.1 hypothetical protein PV07_12678 [Cladophialophora immunda]